MKKVELVEAVAKSAGLTKSAAAQAVDATFEAITKALKKGEKVPVVGFGTYIEKCTVKLTKIGQSKANLIQ